MKKIIACLISILIILIILSYPSMMWEIYRSKIKRAFHFVHKQLF